MGLRLVEVLAPSALAWSSRFCWPCSGSHGWSIWLRERRC